MPPTESLLSSSAPSSVAGALSKILGQAVQGIGSLGSELGCGVSPCHDARFGDYQSNVAMAAAKALGKPPRAGRPAPGHRRLIISTVMDLGWALERAPTFFGSRERSSASSDSDFASPE